jgi:transcriptional regulator with AAA-type ATPase domain
VKEPWEQREQRHKEETKRQLSEALRVCDWNQAAAARELGMSRQAFWKQLKRNMPMSLIAAEGAADQFAPAGDLGVNCD